MTKFISLLSDISGRLAAWMFVGLGLIITYEVAMRYVFIAPTIWAEEIARLIQLWATYLAAAYALKTHRFIRVTVVVDRLGPKARYGADAFGLVVIIAFSVWAMWYGTQIVIDSIEIGRASSTMLALPSWVPELAIPVGFALLIPQALEQLLTLHKRPAPIA